MQPRSGGGAQDGVPRGSGCRPCPGGWEAPVVIRARVPVDGCAESCAVLPSPPTMLVMQMSSAELKRVLPCNTTRRGTGPGAVAAAPPSSDDGIDELADVEGVVNDGDGIDSVVEKPPNSGMAHAGSRQRHSSSASYFFFKSLSSGLASPDVVTRG